MATTKLEITTPVGRIVGGSLYEPQTTDAKGNPLVVKNGPNKGQARTNYFFALGIPKAGEQHWANTEWGQKIWQFACQAWPQYVQSRDFAWKIEDGDDATPNPQRQGRRNCDNEGYAGHWIIKFSGGFAPGVHVMEGTDYRKVLDKDYVKPGYYVQVLFSVTSNESTQTPGLYLNHHAVCMRGFGAEISFGPDIRNAGFGAAPLPAGASAIPLAGSAPMPMQPGMMPQPQGMPMQPGMMPQQGVPQVAGAMPAPLAPAGSVQQPYAPAPTAAAAAQIPVMPNQQFMQMPAPHVGRQLTQLGLQTFGTYEAAIANNWTDVGLVQHGYMTA